MKKLFKSQLLIVFILSAMLMGCESQKKFGGLALYTVRNEMGADLDGTLQQVADAGYKYIEAAGYQDGKYYGLTPEEFRKKVEALGMVPLSTHQSSATLDNIDEELAAAKEAGFKYFVIPVPPMGHFKFDPETRSLSMSEELDSLVYILNTMGKKAKEAGLQLLYHNHNMEFVKNSQGLVPYDYFMENLDPENVKFEMDLYWIVKAGADPVAYFEKYPGRFEIWHVKDMDDQGRFAPVGNGTIDFGALLAHKDQAGMKYYFVEQDQTFDGMKPLEAIRISHDGLKKFGFK